jgi:NADPH:quinone reductase-like Zn-dependent oxidoreductase
VLAATITGGGVQIAEHPDPRPGDFDLLVRVASAGINNADVMQIAGYYPAPTGSPPDIPGLEFAGEVVATGAYVTRFEVGERVMALVGGGAHAELAVAHERLAMAVPANLDLVSAGCFPEAFVTAHDALFTQCGLAMGERVLIHGAAGGVGTAAVQFAAAAGAEVIATVRSEDQRARVAELGAQVVAPEDFTTAGPFDVVLELVGGDNMPKNVDALAEWGRICVIGMSGGSTTAELDLRALMACRGRICSSTLRSRPIERRIDAVQRAEAHVVPQVRRGHVLVPVFAEIPLQEAPLAYERFRAGGKFGKIALTME